MLSECWHHSFVTDSTLINVCSTASATITVFCTAMSTGHFNFSTDSQTHSGSREFYFHFRWIFIGTIKISGSGGKKKGQVGYPKYFFFFVLIMMWCCCNIRLNEMVLLCFYCNKTLPSLLNICSLENTLSQRNCSWSPESWTCRSLHGARVNKQTWLLCP